MSVRRLVVRSELQADESLAGHLVRLSEYNGLASPLDLLRHVGLKVGFDRHRAGLDRLASFIGDTVCNLEAASLAPLETAPNRPTINGVPIGRVHLLTSGARACPHCLKERGYACRLWHLRSYAACHRHGVALIDHCGKCQRPLTWSRSTLATCPCGEAFQPGSAVSESLVRLSGLIAQAASGEAPAPFLARPVEAISTLAWFFGASHLNDAKGRKRAQLRQASVAAALPILEGGAPYVLDWRPTFEAWAEDRFATQNAVGLRWQFGPELTFIQNAFEDICPFVVEDLRQYLSTKWQGFMLRNRSYFCVKPSTPRFLTLTQATKLLGIPPRVIRNYVETGFIAAFESSQGTRRYLALRVDSVEKLRRHLAGMLTAEQAGAAFGVSAHRIMDLYRAGYVRPAVRVSRKPRFDPSELQRFCSSIGSPTKAAVDAVCVATTRTVAFIDLIRHISEGRVHAWFGSSAQVGFDNLFVSQAALEECRRSQGASEPFVANHRAAIRLNLEGRTLSAFVRALDLSAVWEGGRLIAISELAVKEWEGRILTSGRVGADHGLSGAAVNRRLVQLGITPLMATCSSQKVSAVWLSEDLERVDFSAQWITATGRHCSPAIGGAMRLIDTRKGPTIGQNDVSLVELQKTLHINRDTLSLLARKGFLEPGGLTKASHLRGVTRRSAEAFNATYVSSTEVSRLTGLSAIAATRRILAHGIEPITLGASSTRYQFCWKRSEIAQIDFVARYKNAHGFWSKPPSGEYAAIEARRAGEAGRAIAYRVAIDFLGTNSASLRFAIDQGFIGVTKMTVRGSVSALEEEGVMAFSRKYVFTPQLSTETGISENALAKALRLRGVQPVFSGRAPIQALWDRDSLNLGDLLGAWARSDPVERLDPGLPF